VPEYSINLREWREERRKRRNDTVKVYVVLSLLLGAGAAYLWGMVVAGRTERVEANLRLLQGETRKYQPKAQKVKTLEQQYIDLKTRRAGLQKLERDRMATPHLWRIMPDLLPRQVYFTKLERKNIQISIEGKAPSGEAVIKLASNMKASCYFVDARIDQQNAQPRDAFGSTVWFHLSATEKRPQPGESPDEA
jgi:Tfp pilus assembly protein PilN